ncbi:unnamed protein product [Cylicocyclus nassatus]|uniref:Uncharacterized protein n=1 Tax=Cylicocyclus nassatus TaxID=53992 RepID=A0AA36DUB0_CYLNA|nr:unnamed protein product [Cylicocyclus nassatus]
MAKSVRFRISHSSSEEVSTASSISTQRAGKDIPEDAPIFCCCQFNIVLEILLMMTSLSGALIFASYIMYTAAYVELIITLFGIVVPLYAIWAAYRKKLNELLIIGIFGIIYGLYFIYRIIRLMDLYFGYKGEEAIIRAYHSINQDTDNVPILAGITYIVAFTVKIGHLTLVLVVSTMCLKIKYFKVEPLSQLSSRASKEDVDDVHNPE